MSLTPSAATAWSAIAAWWAGRSGVGPQDQEWGSESITRLVILGASYAVHLRYHGRCAAAGRVQLHHLGLVSRPPQ